MRRDKRAWIYRGLLDTGGVGLVRPVEVSATMPPVRPRLGPGASLLLLGDSLALGLARPLQHLARASFVSFRLLARDDTTLADWAEGPWLDGSAQPTHALVSLGTKDMLRATLTSDRAAVAVIVEKLRDLCRVVVWVMPPSLPFADHGVREAIAAAGVKLFPSDALDIPRGPDRVHPTTAGYAGWAGAIWSFLS